MRIFVFESPGKEPRTRRCRNGRRRRGTPDGPQEVRQGPPVLPDLAGGDDRHGGGRLEAARSARRRRRDVHGSSRLMDSSSIAGKRRGSGPPMCADTARIRTTRPVPAFCDVAGSHASSSVFANSQVNSAAGTASLKRYPCARCQPDDLAARLFHRSTPSASRNVQECAIAMIVFTIVRSSGLAVHFPDEGTCRSSEGGSASF